MKNPSRRRHLQYGRRRIAFSLRRSARRTVRVVVSPDRRVAVLAPRGVSGERVLSFVRQKLPWIVRKLDAIEAYHPLPAPRKYVSGETLVYLGRQYRLRVRAGPRETPRLIGRFLHVGAPRRSRRQARRMVEEWYLARAREVFSRSMAQCRMVASRHGVTGTVWAIRTMKRRWGSCGKKGRIMLNTKLVQVPAHCVEYVIMHELCHAKIPSHRPAFFSLLTRCMPDWRRRKDILSRLAVS